MQNFSSKENFYIGLALSDTSNCDSSVCVMDRNSNIILIDKFYFTNDIAYFIENSPYISSSILCTTVTYNNKILEGKWRIHSKNYKMLSDYFKINKDNWTERISKRCCDVLSNLNKKGIKVIRTDINQLRQAYKLQAYYLEGTSIDCKNLQTSLKYKFNLNLPENMLPYSALQAVMCSLFAKEYANNLVETQKIFEIEKIPVLLRNFDS